MRINLIKNFSILGLTCLCLISNSSVQAKEITCNNLTQEELQYIIEQSDPNDLDLSCKNGTPYTDDYLNSSNSNLKINTGIQPYALTRMLNIPEFKQEKSNWCGPANLKQVLHYYNGTSKTQQEYANETETDKYGSAYVYRMRNVLNKYVPSGIKYTYTLGSKLSLDSFFGLVEATTLNKRPMILHAMTKSLEIYNGKNLGHYLTVTGYADMFGVGYNDTYYKDYGKGSVFGFHIDSKENVYKTVSVSGRYIIHDTESMG